MFNNEGRVFLTPLWFNADMSGKVYDGRPSARYGQKIGCCLKYFIRVKVLQNDILQNPFFIAGGINNCGAELDWDTCRSCCIYTGTSGIASCIIDTNYFNSGMMKPERITVPLVVNSSNRGNLEYFYSMFSHISSGGMREHNAGSVIIGKDQGALESTRCEYYLVGTNMPDPYSGTFVWC